MTSSPGADAGPPPHHPAQTTAGAPSWHALALLLVLLAVIAAGVASRGVTAPVDAAAATDVFSAARASQAVAPVVAEPRPVGSTANDRAHTELSEQLDALGFETRAQEGLGVRENGDEASSGYVRNLVATRPGSDPTGTIVLATHIDSVPNAPGAADAGVGLAVILETVRALGPEALRNDLVVLLVDGEERGLLGAEAYLDEAAEELTAPVVVLNHEARGISGRPMVTRAEGPMHAVIGASPSPEYESFTDALFGIIPNDTDFTAYREGGWWGMDMAIIDGAWAYHSAQDDVEHLDAGTLQHYGELTLALTRDLTGRDLAELETRAAEQPVQTTAPWGVVALPPLLVTVLGLLAPLAVLAAALVARGRSEVSLRGVLGGAAASLLTLAVAVLGATLLWSITAGATPSMLSQTTREPVRAEPFLLAELALAGAVVTAGWVLTRMLISRAALLLGGSLLVTALLAALAVYSPALGGSMILPAAIAAGGIVLAAVLPPLPGLVVRLLALVPTGWLLGTQLQALGEFGIASSAGGLAGTALIGLGAAGALLLSRPGTEPRPSRRPRRLLAPLLPAVLVAALTIGGTAWTLAAPEPTQERVVAHVDAGDGATTWEVSGSTEWGRALDGTQATSEVEMPTLEVAEAADGRVEISFTAVREASAVELTVGEGKLSQVRVDGVEVDSSAGLNSLGIHGLRAGQTVVVTADAAAGTELVAVETSFDPSLATGWDAPGEEVSLMQPCMEVVLTAQL